MYEKNYSKTNAPEFYGLTKAVIKVKRYSVC